jgi:hypothetical protein
MEKWVRCRAGHVGVGAGVSSMLLGFLGLSTLTAVSVAWLFTLAFVATGFGLGMVFGLRTGFVTLS